ncbi:MAG: hypothetical protein EA424_00790 [Planctomycetaceae bacterium]|nr:MAG: hypothetical protein EA424_00790 [Planctomycetaceae bacterium]
MEAMQTRVFGAPRADLADGARDWFRVLSQRWHPVRKIEPQEIQRATIEQPDNILPLIEGWRRAIGEMDPAAWTRPGREPAGEWKDVRLGSFLTMELPDDALARFRKEVELPPNWRNLDIRLVFDAGARFGINASGRLWINGEPVAIGQPIRLTEPPFNPLRIALTPEQTASGRLVIALEVDGRPAGNPARPKGVSGSFFLEARPRPLRTMPLDTWSAASDINVLAPATVDTMAAKPLYLETRFTLPAQWPAKRLWLVSSDQNQVLRRLIINNYHVAERAGRRFYDELKLTELDISGLVTHDGENVLRWVPDARAPELPKLNLLWTE